MSILQLRLYCYKIFAIVSIIKSFWIKKLCPNEVYVIVGQFIIRFPCNELWFSKEFSFFKINFIQQKKSVFVSKVFYPFSCVSVLVQLQWRGTQSFWYLGREQRWLLHSVLPWNKLPPQKTFCYIFFVCRVSNK